jgi:hypothetical protein
LCRFVAVQRKDGGSVEVRAKKKAGKNGKLGINPVFPAYDLPLLKDELF